MIKLYNTLTRQKQDFIPLSGKVVKIYTCGPTIYDHAHIGNFSLYLFVDLLKRFLKYSGYKIEDVMNLTDVDDKTIRASREHHKELIQYTAKFARLLFKDFKTLNIKKPKYVVKATEHIAEMIELIKKLEAKGFAYRSDDGSVYFKVSKFVNYGELAHLDRANLKFNADNRVAKDEYEDKENLADFALWKAWSAADGDVAWESPWGKGRPGWHIECSAMSMKYLGETLDIHTGGEDLIFPHHQNEIAQSEAVTGKPFVHYWLHRAFLKVDGKKMSKSLNNFYTLNDLLDKVSDPLAFRYLIVTNHYRLPLNFSIESLQASAVALKRIHDFISRLQEQNTETEDLVAIKKLTAESKKAFKLALSDDLDTPKAIATWFDYQNQVNKLIDENKVGKLGSEIILKFIKKIDNVWGFMLVVKKVDNDLATKVEKLIVERNEARVAKDFSRADAIREELTKLGVELKDEAGRTTWSTI